MDTDRFLGFGVDLTDPASSWRLRSGFSFKPQSHAHELSGRIFFGTAAHVPQNTTRNDNVQDNEVASIGTLVSTDTVW
jgi:hypothetical protein